MRRWILFAICLVLACPALASISVTDMLQRHVTLAGPAKRIVLGESRHILTLALLEQDPLKNVVGWGDDLQRYSPATWQAILAQHPEAKNIPLLGTMNMGTFSLEATIATKPDLVIFTLYGPPPPGLEKLDAAHIPYIFVDFFRKPLTNTLPSLRLLGNVLGEDAKAAQIIAFIQQHEQNIEQRLRQSTQRPRVFFHLNPGKGDCCFTSGNSNMKDFIAAAGGHNIGSDYLSAPIGKMNAEAVISQQPDFYLLGGGSSVAQGGLQIGPGVTPQQAANSVARLLQHGELRTLNAISHHQAGGVWLFFFDSPLWFVGVEALAKMFHPQLFADLNPQATLDSVNREYLALPLNGTFWSEPGH